ncbi:MAG TPA: hypothetical protein VIV11_38935, partial [Kofleriaceae bacterium]
FDCVDSFCETPTEICTAYRPLGAPCMSDSNCLTGACITDVCTELAGPGEACVVTTSDSGCSHVGHTCSAASNTCVPVGLSGDACASANDCSPIYLCSTAASCELRPTLGRACNDQALPGPCLDHSWCDPTTLQCAAPKPDGSMCDGDDECTSRNCDFATTMCTTPPICI